MLLFLNSPSTDVRAPTYSPSVEGWAQELGTPSKVSRHSFRIVTSLSETLGTVHTCKPPAPPHHGPPEAEAELPESHMSPQASLFTTLPASLSTSSSAPRGKMQIPTGYLEPLSLLRPWREWLIKKDSKDSGILRPGSELSSSLPLLLAVLGRYYLTFLSLSLLLRKARVLMISFSIGLF